LLTTSVVVAPLRLLDADEFQFDVASHVDENRLLALSAPTTMANMCTITASFRGVPRKISARVSVLASVVRRMDQPLVSTYLEEPTDVSDRHE